MTAFISDRDVEYYAARGKLNYYSAVWAYSFWGRRHNENPGNLLLIASALKVLRDELYAPNAPTPALDREHPPIEPFLASKLRPGEPIYQWKMYTNRVEFVSPAGDEADFYLSSGVCAQCEIGEITNLQRNRRFYQMLTKIRFFALYL